MVIIQPLKQQYLTALKERQQIINKLNEIITGLNGIDFDDLTNIHTELITIRESIEQIDSEIGSLDNRLISANTEITDIEAHLNEFEQETEVDLQSKVNKSGDTMTGNLSIPLTGTGKKDSYAVNGDRLQNDLDNYAFMVRTSDNQIINGIKTFTSSPTIQNTWLWFKNDTITTGGIYSAYLSDKTMGSTYMRTYNSKGQNTSIAVQLTDDGVGAGYAPTTPTNATSNEIATADWVISKINEFATANNLQVIQ